MVRIHCKLLLIVVIGQLIATAAAQNGETHLMRLKTIAELQSEYLINEENLWQRIDVILNDVKDVDESSVNKTIIDVLNIHRPIFFDITFESTSYWRSYLLYRIEHFREYLSNINDTLEESYQYLYDASEHIIYKPSDIEMLTRDTKFHQLKENSDGLYNLTVHQKDVILDHIQTEAKCCIQYVNYVISEAQLVREYYANVGRILLRSYAMNQMSHMLMSLSMHRNLHGDANAERKLYLQRYADIRRAIESMLTASSLDLWKCNPNPYLDSRTYYTSITYFMQGYIDNEINLNEQHTCDGSCSVFKSTKNIGCQPDTLCAQAHFAKTRCRGNIFDCSVIESNGTACRVKDEWEKRRYNYVTFNNGSMNGHNVLCFKAEQMQLSTRSERITNDCDNCFCFCDEPGGRSDRYFSLRELTSDIDANKIVTGIAIDKIDRVIQFSISERELFPFGKVNDTLRRTQVWKDNTTEEIELDVGVDGIDYFTLTRQHRSINLDTIYLPSNKVVTGVRFQVQNNRVHLEIRATDFDYESGKLKNLKQSAWFNNLISEEREELVINEPDSPLRTNRIQERFDSNNKFIQFRSTDIKKDLAQLTVPFLETVQLEASEPRPLSGAGLYYKGEEGYGGFIAIKLIGFDTGTI